MGTKKFINRTSPVVVTSNGSSTSAQYENARTFATLGRFERKNFVFIQINVTLIDLPFSMAMLPSHFVVSSPFSRPKGTDVIIV